MSSCRPSRRSGASSWPRWRTVASMSRSSTAPCAGCCARRSSSGCSTPTGRRSPPRSPASASATSRAASTWTPPRTATWPASSPSARSCSMRNDGTLPLRSPRRIAVIGPNAADPYAVLGCYSFPSHVGQLHPEMPVWASHCRPCSTPSASRVPGCGGRAPARAPRSTAASSTASRMRWRPRGPPTSRSWCSATGPACSAAAPAGRAATRRPSGFRAPSRSCSTRCSHRGRRPRSCCSPGGRTRWAVRRRRLRPSWRRSSRARRARRRSPASSAAGSTRAGASR